MKYRFRLQYFAEEAEKNENTGGKPTLDAEGESVNIKTDFDELIRGEYRDEYSKRVEDIVKNRLKDHSELKKNLGDITSALTELKNELGIEAEGVDGIIAELKEHIRKEKGDVDAKGADTREKKENASPLVNSENAGNTMAKLLKGCDETKELYPQFDIKKEFSNPDFRRILKLTDNDPKKAFEILHHDEIIAGVIKDTARMTEERLAGSIASRAARPAEGAQSAASAVYINRDPKSLSKADRADIKKRVRRGERIVW